MARDVDGDLYRTTSKGIKFLETSRKLGGLLEASPQQKQV
jgi:hypothetical protein